MSLGDHPLPGVAAPSTIVRPRCESRSRNGATRVGSPQIATAHQRRVIATMALAHRAGDPDVGQKIHFQLGRAVALAGLAAAAADVEAEPARLVAAGLRLGQLRVEAGESRRRP